MQYKRFLLFEIISYYPSGGLGDATRSFDTIDEVADYIRINKNRPDDYELLDLQERCEVDLSKITPPLPL